MLDPQMKRGLLEACVLSALARGDSYGYKIVKDLSVCVQVLMRQVGKNTASAFNGKGVCL